MANSLYNKGREDFALGNIDWVSDNIDCNLVDLNDYTVDLATHDFIDDVPGGAVVATQALASKTATAGVCDAANTTFSTVSGDQSEGLVLNKNTGTPATSALIVYIDTATGLPVTPNGGDIVVQWSDGAYKIFRL